jgi:hypothetical protein
VVAVSFSVKFVRQYRTQKVVYDVEMMSMSDSQSIRDAYGLFFRKKSGKKMPNILKGISISNVTTFSTRVRVRLLKEVCRKHQLANPTVSCFVTAYLPRPELKIRDRKGPLTSLSYTKTVQKMSHHLSYEFLRDLTIFARTNLPEEEISERFLVLHPDLLSASPPQHEASSMSVDEDVNQVSSPSVNSTPSPTISAVPTSNPALATVPVSQASQIMLTSSPLPQNGAEDEGDFIVVNKRNRGRFTKKSTPYSLPS